MKTIQQQIDLERKIRAASDCRGTTKHTCDRLAEKEKQTGKLTNAALIAGFVVMVIAALSDLF